MQRLGSFFAVLLFFAPTLSLLVPAFTTSSLLIGSNFLLKEYAINTIVMVIGVGMLASICGVSSACVVTFLRFPGRRILKYMLFLPLAMPSYIAALAYVELFDITSYFSLFLRESLGIKRLFQFRSLWGAIFVMTFTFYPYVYMFCLARVSCMGNLVCIARSCGKSFMATMCKVVIPVSRPAIIAGLTLVMMEVISDFGTMQFFGVQTLVTAIYRKWFLLNDFVGASRMLLLLLFCVVFFVFIEKKSRKNSCYMNRGCRSDIIPTWTVRGAAGIGVFLLFFSLPLFGLFVPLISLMMLALDAELNVQVLTVAFRSIEIASFASLGTVVVAAILIYLKKTGKISSTLFYLANLGYAIPGLVLGIGIITFFSSGSFVMAYITENLGFMGFNIFASGTFAILIYSYVFRFLALGSNSIQSGVDRIPSELSWMMRLIGKTSFMHSVKVYLPMVIRFLVTAVVLIFVDTLKELPATLLVRPFNFETMATRVYGLVLDERYNDAALPAVMMTFICLTVIIFLIKLMYGKSLHNTKKRDRIGCVCDVCLSKNECHN